MPEFTLKHGISSPLPEDLIKSASFAAKLASDIKALAVTADAAITTEGVRAEADAIAAAAIDAKAKVDAAKYYRGAIPFGSNLNTFLGEEYAGIWTFTDGLNREIQGLPPGVRSGTLTVLEELGGQMLSNYKTSEGPEALWYRGRAALGGANPFGEWQDLTSKNTVKYPGRILSTDDLDFWYGPQKSGVWSIASTSTAQATKNLPIPAPGKLINISDNNNVQIYVSIQISGYPAGYFVRSRGGLPTAVWTEWVNLMAPTTAPASTEEYALKHSYRNDTARKRLGYKIGAPCIIALRFSDYNAAFRDKVLPILREFDVPATMGLAVDWVEGRVNHALAEAVPWSEVQSWVLNDGLEPEGHSWTHSAASTTAQITKEIVESADYMEQQMPAVVIDQWSMPGTGSSEPYGGYHGKAIEDFTETLAGKLLLSRYGFVGAARGGYLQPGGGVDYIGQSHGVGENLSVAAAKVEIEKAIQGGFALSMLHHPGWLDTVGYKTTTQLRELIEWLSEQRELGRLILTTRRAMNVFDNAATHRDNLLPGPFNGQLWGWTGGVTINSSGNALVGSGSSIEHTLQTLPIAWARGGAREFSVILKVSTATTIRLRVVGNGLDSTKDYVVAPGQWVSLRRYFTIPTNAPTITHQLSVLSGGSAEIQQLNCYAT